MILTHFVLLQPGVHVLDDVRLVLQLVDEALQLAEVSRVVHGLKFEIFSTRSEIFSRLTLK